MRSARGTIAIWAAMAVAFLLGFVALVINGGHLLTVKAELQNGVDAAALAGARQLSGNLDEITPPTGSPVEAAARTLASLHTTDRPDLPMALERVVLGQWRPASRPGCEDGDALAYAAPGATRPLQDSSGAHLCEVTARDGAAALRINAVYARASRAAGATEGGGPVRVFMSPLMGTGTSGWADVSNEAIAVSGGPAGRACIRVPMVIGVGCLTSLAGGDAACPAGAAADAPGPMYALGASSTQVRSMGWSVFATGGSACGFMQAGASACIESLRTDVRVDASVNVLQGNHLNDGCAGGPGVAHVCDWFKPFVGQLIEVPVVSESGSLGEACPSTYNQSMTVVGFTTLRVLAANCRSGCVGPGSCNDAGQPCNAASGDCVLTQLVCNHEARPDQSTGGAWTGTSTFHPRLVQSRGAVAP